jgi:hypothetical protein
MKLKQELPGSLRISRRKVKEGIPSTAALSGGTPIVWFRQLNDIASIRGDRRDQRFCRVKREDRLPVMLVAVIPADCERLCR